MAPLAGEDSKSRDTMQDKRLFFREEGYRLAAPYQK